MTTLKRCLFTGLLLTTATLSARAGSFFSDFNTGALPPGTHTNSNSGSGGSGGAYLELSGGINDSGCLKICKNVNSQNGSFVLDDLDAGQPIYGFDITFKMRVGGGGGTPADGIALCVAPDLQDTSIWGETGTGSGLRFCWATYPFSGQTQPDPSLKVRVGAAGTIVAYKGYDVNGLSTGGSDASTWWADVHIRLNPNGSLNFDYKGVNVFTNFFIPGYQTLADAGVPMRFGFGGRTGGANDNFWVDNLQITTFLLPNVGFSQQPFSQKVLQGDNATFDTAINNPTGVTLQWFSNNVAIAGANSTTLVVSNVQPASSGAKYKLTATGPNNTVTSTEVTLTVTNLTLPSTPQLSFNFNDGALPAGTTNTGTTFVDTTGGIGDSGALKLALAANGQLGAFLISDPDAGVPVYGFTARFKILVGGGSVRPADGWNFAFGSDIPDSPSGNLEEGIGLGTGLRVNFDIYDNDNILGWVSAEPQPAPSIDVRFGNQVVATAQFPISFIETGTNVDGTPAYDDAIIQLSSDGTLNVVYRGDLVFDHLPIPGFSFVSGGRFALAARTGGANDNYWFDNIELTTITNSSALRIVTSPADLTVLVNHAGTFNVSVNDTNAVTYQWLRSGTNIAGATASSYTLPSAALADSGVNFSVLATKSSLTVTSSVAKLTVVNLTAPTSPNLSFNFNDGLVPPGTALYSNTGGGTITPNGGVGDSGVLHITDSANGQSGAFVISNLYNGAQVSAIAASWDLRLGGGSGNPADGYSFNFANNLTQGVSGGEQGNGTGISVCFDIYGAYTDAGSPAPAVNIRYKGALIASSLFTKNGGTGGPTDVETGTGFRTVLLRVDSDGKLYMSYGELVLFNGLQLPNYTFTTAGQFGFYGRTGGENENQWVDNLLIQATKSTGPLTVTVQPVSTAVVAGSTATFSVGLSDPNGATYQWAKNGTSIGGATAASYTTPITSLADNGALFKVTATSANGTAISSNAVLTVVAPITVNNPIISYNFNDGLLPDGTTLNGNGGGGYIAGSGGIGDSGVLHLTDNVNGQGGTFIMPDPNTNAPINAMTAHFAIRVADGSGRPADGFSFVWASSNDIPNNIVFSQNGIGQGLIVGFDTYNNSGEAPSFNVWYKGNYLVNKLVDYSALATGGYSTDPLLQYADVYIRVNANGTLDLQYHGNAILVALPLPGYAPMAGGEFAIGAATGGENETHWVDNIQIATSVGLVPIPISLTRTGASLRLSWSSALFKLQSTASLAPANWQDVTGAVSPFTVSASTGTQFYRLAPAP